MFLVMNFQILVELLLVRAVRATAMYSTGQEKRSVGSLSIEVAHVLTPCLTS